LSWKGLDVPDVITSGNHQAVNEWREREAARKTVLSHFQWLQKYVSSHKDKKRASEYIPYHYAVLMHDQVVVQDGKHGTSSVTSLDLHDIARSAATYGIKKYFIVTPLKDQQKIVSKLLEFWQTDVGKTYNSYRYDALSRVVLVSSLDEVDAYIQKETGQSSILIATAARKGIATSDQTINYTDQCRVWKHEKPVGLVFGTAKGLSDHVISSCDYVLRPLQGFSHFNHLSVRSAAAIVFDRWLGIHNVSDIT
jgi:tRNA (guanine37-N1)-methyltransferase